jgi:hypothetical protein
MKILSTVLFLALVLMLSGNVSADTKQINGDEPSILEVVPNSYAGVKGTGTFLRPLANTERTYKFLIHANQLTNLVGKFLTGFSMRIPASATANWPVSDVTYSAYDVYLSRSVDPSARSLAFANNIIGPKHR